MFYGHKIKTNQYEILDSHVIEEESKDDSDNEDKIEFNSELVNK